MSLVWWRGVRRSCWKTSGLGVGGKLMGMPGFEKTLRQRGPLLVLVVDGSCKLVSTTRCSALDARKLPTTWKKHPPSGHCFTTLVRQIGLTFIAVHVVVLAGVTVAELQSLRLRLIRTIIVARIINIRRALGRAILSAFSHCWAHTYT